MKIVGKRSSQESEVWMNHLVLPLVDIQLYQSPHYQVLMIGFLMLL